MALTQVKTLGIADDAVTGAKIADDTVAEANIANDAISLAELKAGTDGQIITYDASGNPTAVGPGTDGQVLTSTGAGSPPAFEDAISEGTSIKSTGESGGTKFLREDGDGTSSWQAVSVPDADKIIEGNTKVECTDTGGGSDGTVVIETDGTEAFRVTNGQKVGIGETAPLGQLHVKSGDSGQSAAVAWGDDLVVEGSGDAGITILSGNAADASLIFGDDGDADVGRVVYNHSSNFLGFDASAGSRMKVKGDGDVEIVDGNLKIGTAGHGIDFSATSDGGASQDTELLDDYEEGVWTPTAEQGCTSVGSYTPHYVKIGNQCTVYAYIHQIAGADSNAFRVGGLPYSVYSSKTAGLGNVILHASDFPDSHMQTCANSSAGNSWFGLFASRDDYNWYTWDGNSVENGGTLIVTLTYRTN